MSSSATSTHFLNASRDRDSTTSLGRLCQCLTSLSVKKFVLIFNLKLPWPNLRPLPLVLSLAAWEKRPTPPHYKLPSGSCREQYMVPPQPPPDWTTPVPSAASLLFLTCFSVGPGGRRQPPPPRSPQGLRPLPSQAEVLGVRMLLL